jgi:long-chain acyl-CoA synthetase
LENFASTLEKCLASAGVAHVVVCAMGDLLGPVKGAVVNWVVRKVKGMVPEFQLPAMVRFNAAIAQGRRGSFTKPVIGPDDVAVLQYTGGTTGVSKGAVLLHRHLVANVLQAEAWNLPAMRRIPALEQPTGVCALPLYHIFAFTISMMLSLRQGGKTILIPNPRDIPAVLKALAPHRIHTFPAVSSLFSALVNHPDFARVDWSHLTSSVGGGTAVLRGVAQRWLEQTGCAICEGYGLSETSPSVCCNPADIALHDGSIGPPLPNTWVKLLDDEGHVAVDVHRELDVLRVAGLHSGELDPVPARVPHELGDGVSEVQSRHHVLNDRLHPNTLQLLSHDVDRLVVLGLVLW